VGKYSKDNYSTLDLFIYDKLENKYYMCKNGASDSYLVGENRMIIKGNDLPLGIIDKKEYVSREIKLSKGDLLFMVSDGVGELDLVKLDKFKNKNCQKISEIIMNMNDDICDDKTVFVIKVC
jgi:serine phosphatase RsbU (regulator of sigma subunit)